jgi:hypothetical protein
MPVRDSIIAAFSAKEYHFRRVKRVAFLCGGQASDRRERIKEYFTRHRPDFLVFYAEQVWSVIAHHRGTTNALAAEAELAQLADIVIIVVESAGTFTELGAFSLSPDLRSKLLPILPLEHQLDESFINTGPIRWIDSDSDFRPSIWANHRMILSAADQLDDRLSRFPAAGSVRVSDIAHHAKHLLFFICDLIAVFGPTSVDHIDYYCRQIVVTPTAMPVRLLVALAEALGLIKALPGGIYYYRPLEDGRLTSFQYKRRYIDFVSLRAQVIEVLQRIDTGTQALNQLEAANGAR